jgi:hypothetical protein|tara:strand:- start:90 stop:257 length:168 start_codon:yes stop_codon:yes gene_type:complete
MSGEFFVVSAAGSVFAGPLPDDRYAWELANDLNRASQADGMQTHYFVAGYWKEND